MQRVDIHVKVELVLDDKDDPEKVGTEICRQVMKSYGVRSAEVSTIVERE